MDGSGVEDLDLQIKTRAGMSVESDPRVCKAQKRVEEFRAKAADVQSRIEQLKNDLTRKEKEIGDRVLKGGPASVAELARPRQKLIEAEEEGNILAASAQQAEAAATDLMEKVSREHNERNRGLLVAVVEELDTALQTAVARIKFFRTASALRSLVPSLGITDTLFRLQREARFLQSRVELLKKNLGRMKDEGDPGGTAKHG